MELYTEETREERDKGDQEEKKESKKGREQSSESEKVTQSCLTLFYPMDYTVHGIL